MLITGARVAINGSETVQTTLTTHRGRVSFHPLKRNSTNRILSLEGHLIVPGLINAHDHLELNLFPRLGHGPYPNAVAWARDIYHPRESPIREHVAIPKSVRLHWGALKNLLSGVTTVAHHNPPDPHLFSSSFPIRVVQRYQWAHSLTFSLDWKERHQNTPEGAPFLIHAGEGTDEQAEKEIDLLYESSVLDAKTVLVHGVALRKRHLGWLRQGGTSLVWCPSSNMFTLGHSLSPETLKSRIPIALGSDSGLSACGDLLDEARLARMWVKAPEIYRMMTSTAARILKLPAGYGEIRNDGPADLAIFPDTGCSPAECLVSSFPEMVLVRGRIVLVSERLAQTVRGIVLPTNPFSVAGRPRYFSSSPIGRMVDVAVRYVGAGFALAGKKVEQ